MAVPFYVDSLLELWFHLDMFRISDVSVILTAAILTLN
jgi:hypothetical protein